MGENSFYRNLTAVEVFTPSGTIQELQYRRKKPQGVEAATRGVL